MVDIVAQAICRLFVFLLPFFFSPFYFLTSFELRLLITPLVSPNLSYIVSMYLQLLSKRVTSVWLVWSLFNHSLKLSMKIKQQWQNYDSCPQWICGLVDVVRVPDVKTSTPQVQYAIFFASSCLWGWCLCLFYVIFVFVCVWWCPTRIMLCFYSSCVPYVVSFSGFSICDCPFGILWCSFIYIYHRPLN